MKIHFLDTSVFCNILNVPFMSDERDLAVEEFKEIVENSEQEKIILPFATIIETGNHIAHINEGYFRYKIAQKFSEAVLKTINGDAPWSYYGSQLTEEDLKKICTIFPNEALYNNTGVGDLSIVSAYEKYKEETIGIEEIRIWSYDHHLEQYHEKLDLANRRNRRRR